MPTQRMLSTTHQPLIGALLVLLLIATRGHHFASLQHLPGATWAVFFLAGVYLRPRQVLPALLAFIWVLDFVPHLMSGASLSEIFGGDQVFCMTPAYLFLLPAYSALWFAGRWYADQYRFEWQTLMPLAMAAFCGAVLCELFSSGGFYFLSGRFAETSIAKFASRELTYFPGYLQSLAFYLGIATLIHTLFGLVRGSASDKTRLIR